MGNSFQHEINRTKREEAAAREKFATALEGVVQGAMNTRSILNNSGVISKDSAYQFQIHFRDFIELGEKLGHIAINKSTKSDDSIDVVKVTWKVN